MNRAALESQVLNELRHLPLEKAKDGLDFVLFLRSRTPAQDQPQTRPLGLLKDIATCRIAEDFEISDEEHLQL